MTCFRTCSQAQTLEEWTKQKKLESSYKIKQIAALSAYLEVAKKGYEVARIGWDLIGDIQSGEFSLQSGYFGSLTAVHPIIRDYPIAMQILKLHRQINREVDWMNTYANDQMMLDEAEILVVGRFNRKSETQAGLFISELNQLLTSNCYVMDDGERLAAIDQLYIGIQQLYLALKAYNGRIRTLEMHRNRNTIGKEQLNSFYDVK